MDPRGFGRRFSERTFIAFIVLLLSASAAAAAGVKVDAIPSLRLEERMESNVYSHSENEVSSLGTRVAPGLALRFTAPDNVMLQLSGYYERIWYHDSEARDANDSTWNLRIESSGAWRLTPTFSVRPSGYFLRTPDSFSKTQLLASDDPDAPVISIRNFGTVKTDQFGGSLRFEHQASPNLSIGVFGRYSEQRFPDNVVVTGLVDSSQYGGGFAIRYLVSPRSTVGVTGSVQHHSFDNNASSDSYFAGIEFGYQFSPLLRFDATVGGAQVRMDEEGTSEERKESTPAGSFRLSYRAPRSSAGLFGSVLHTGSNGLGETTRQGTVGLAYTYLLAKDWTWKISGAYQISESVLTDDAVDIRTVYGTTGIEYRVWRWVALSARGSLERQKSDGQFGSTVDSYTAVLGVTLGMPYNLY